MTQEELVKRVEELSVSCYEDNTLELKSGAGGFPSIYDTLSSFSNQDSGGVIIIGIDEKSGIVLGVSDIARYEKHIEDACLAMSPNLHVAVTCVDVDNKFVIGVEVPGLPAQQRPCYKFSDGMINGSYVRIGDADRKMPPSLLYEYYNYANRVYPDRLPVNESDISDLQTLAFQEYKVTVGKIKSKFAGQSDEDLLKNSRFALKGQPTLAGLMVLADYPQRYFDNFYISAAVCDSNEENARVLDGEHIDGNIPEMLETAMRFVHRNIRHSIYFRGAERIDVPQYPEVALRELILNALLHRDYGRYAEGRCISLLVHPDKIVIASPGLLYGNMTLESLDSAGYYREVRNPAITSALELLMKTENKGTGIRVARQAMLDHGLKAPEFRQDVANDTFLVTLRSKIGREHTSTGCTMEPSVDVPYTNCFGTVGSANSCSGSATSSVCTGSGHECSCSSSDFRDSCSGPDWIGADYSGFNSSIDK